MRLDQHQPLGLVWVEKGENSLNLALMKLIDAQFLETPFYGSRQMALHLLNQGYCVGRKRIRLLMAQMGLRVVYQRPRTTLLTGRLRGSFKPVATATPMLRL